LQDGRREPDVEAARPHADDERGKEVAGLVDEDQGGEPDDGDQDAHATGALSSVRRRAWASASTRPSRCGTAEAPSAARGASAASATPRKGIRRSRKAATATSFAALKAHG